MIVRQQKQLDFSTKEGQQEKKEFCEKHGLNPENIHIELRRHPNDFFMQENEKGDKRLSASASKGVSYRYYDKENREVMCLDNYVPAAGLEKAVITRTDLKFRYAQPIIITEFDKAFFILEHPDLKGSDLNKIRRPKGEYVFYAYDAEKEAQEKVDRQRAEARAIMAIEDITGVEQLRVIARGFQIMDTENKKEIVLRDELNTLAKAKPTDFLAKMKTEQFKITSLVYEAKEKGKIIYQPAERSWYLQIDLGDRKETGDKIFTHNAAEKPEESLIAFLQSPKSNDWRRQLTEILAEKEISKEVPVMQAPIVPPPIITDDSTERIALEKKARELGIKGAFPKDTEKLKDKIKHAELETA